MTQFYFYHSDNEAWNSHSLLWMCFMMLNTIQYNTIVVEECKKVGRSRISSSVEPSGRV